jgi:hypothetical protein
MASINDLLGAVQQAVTAINGITQQLNASFPPITSVSSKTPGAGTLAYSSSLISAFGLVTTSSGGSYRIALLPSS